MLKLRVKFYFISNELLVDNEEKINRMVREFNLMKQRYLEEAENAKRRKEEAQKAIKLAEIFNGEIAVNHLFKVASSLDSLVIGEREIITQVRKAYELCNSYHLTGDVIRLLVQRTIQLAKKIYTESDISKNPVSIVSLAYHQLKQKNINKDSNFIIVGAGKTIATMLKFLSKHGYGDNQWAFRKLSSCCCGLASSC